jgi:hypothetical protein
MYVRAIRNEVSSGRSKPDLATDSSDHPIASNLKGRPGVSK